MTRFEAKIEEQLKLFEGPEDVPQDGGPGNMQPKGVPAPAPTGDQTTPSPDETPAAPVTSQGKVFLIDLALKALAVDPNTINQYDKAVFNQAVTPQNAEDVLKKIQNIIEGL